MRHCASVVLAAVAIGLTAPVVHGWGPEGHHIVARIALARLTPEAKQGVQALLGSDDFVGAATWADEIRSQRPETYNWHFVDIPFGEMKYDAARDCKPTPQGDCILAQLERARKDLTDASLSQDRRKEALKWLIHLVGDLHMKLVLLGVAIGVAGALAFSRLVRTLLFNVAPSDPASYALTALLLIVVAAIACYVPARRAMRVDPLIAMQVE